MTYRTSTTAFAKSTRPELSGVVPREALFAQLDGTPARTLVWISGPPGFGKTTLVASYLEMRGYRWAWYHVDPDDDDGETFLHYLAHAIRRSHVETDELPVFGPEHRGDLAAFARRFFRALFSEGVGPAALVLDNLHELAAGSPLRTIIEAGLPEVPRNCRLVVTSRAPPPVALARLQLDGQMICLTATDLRFTLPELVEMARLRGRVLPEESLKQMHRHADGWAAALVLMVEHHKLTDAQFHPPGESAPSAVFNYLAGEIFERFEPSIQRVLLRIACLPRIAADVACALSEDDTASRVLFNLAHNDYFVRELVGQEGRLFVLHPLLREFLLHRARRDLPDAVDASALRRAAQLLCEHGQAEDAIDLFVECKDWPEAALVMAQQADALLAQGRHATLAGWLELLPPQILDADPALLQARGAALQHVSPRVARRSFESAFGAFQRRGDAQGASRCCLGAIESMLQEFDDLAGLDRWLVQVDHLHREAVDGTDLPASVHVARLWRDPAHPSLNQIGSGRDAPASAHRDLVRSIAALLTGDVARSAAIVAGFQSLTGAPGLAQATSTALRQLIDGKFAVALATARDALQTGLAQAIHGDDVWLHLICAASALGQPDIESARRELDLIDSRELRRGDRAFLRYLRATLAAATSETGSALREARDAAMLAVESGLPWLEFLARIAMAQLSASEGDRHGAESQARSAEALAQRLGGGLLQLASLFTQAAVSLALGDEAAALVPLQAGFARARDLGVHHVPGLPSDLIARLCAVALQHGIAVDHARMFISAGSLAPPAAAAGLRRWPWAFEIATLGGMQLSRAGRPIEFSAKGPGRPVELLKVLVSLGGLNVRADLLADALWPHVEADYAHKSFTATLHRLRRIFGGDEAFALRDGRLSLNKALFWLDTWSLDYQFGQIDKLLRADDPRPVDPALARLMDEALTLYKGPFLAEDTEQPAYVAMREQLRARVLHMLARVARRWEDDGRFDVAVDCYLRCIDADELCEAFYRNLMSCCQRHGDVAEALATYERLQAVLAARLQSAPSPETQAVHASLRS